MKRRLFLFTFLFFLFQVMNGQDERQSTFTKVEIEAYTDSKAWTEHITKSTRLPDSLLDHIPPGSYKVNVQFIIDKHGNIGQVKAKNNPGYGLEAIAVKIISNYKGAWHPASQCGRNVNAYREQSLTFVIF